MSQSKRSGQRIFGIRTWAPLIVWGLTLAVCVCQAIRPISDPDFWWHLQGGKDTVRRGWPPTEDGYSVLSAGQPWIYDSWLSGLSFYGLYALGGFAAVSLAMAGVYAGALAVGVVRCRRRGAGLLPSCLAALLACWVLESQLRFVPRPYLFALLWTHLVLLQLDRWRCATAGDLDRGDRSGAAWWRSPLAPLVPIAILWVNGHASWPMLFGLLAVYRVDVLVRRLWASAGRVGQIGHAGTFKQWVLIAGVAGAAVLINPYGASLLGAPYQIVFATRWLGTAAEWQATGLAPVFVPFWVYTAVAAGGLLTRRRTVWPADRLLFLLLGGMTLISHRHVLFFVAAMLPACALALERVTGALDRRVRRWVRRGTQSDTEARDPNAEVPLDAPTHERLPAGAATAFGLWLLAVAACAVQLHLAALPRLGIREQGFPVKATAFLQEHEITGDIFNQEDWAGYLLWQVYPASRVYIDSRFTVHSERAQTSYFSTYCGLPGWPEKLHEQGISTIVIAGPDRSGIGRQLVSAPGWVTVYWDDRAVVLVQGTAAVLARRSVKDWSLSNPYFLEEHLAAGGSHEALRQQLEQKVWRDPDCATAWFYLGRVRLEQKKLSDAEQAFARSAALTSRYQQHARLFLAATLLRRDRRSEALNELERLWPARSALPPEAQQVLVGLLTQTGRSSRALRLQQELNQLRVAGQSSHTLGLERARQLLAGGQVQQARARLRRLSRHPEVAAEAHVQLGVLAADQGEAESEIDYHFARALSYRPGPELAEAIRERYRKLRGMTTRE